MGPSDDDNEWNNAIPIEDARRQRERREAGHNQLSTHARFKIGGFSPTVWTGKAAPDRDWLVPGLIPMRQVTMLSGDGGLGKSLLAMQLMTCAATGKTWLGHEVRRCKALGLFCEDGRDELHRRQQDVNSAYGIDHADLDDLYYVDAAERDDVSFATFDRYTNEMEITQYFTSLMNLCIDFGAQCIVLDSLHNFFTGNENFRPQVWSFVRLLRTLAIETNGAVILLAHPSVSGMTSGSGSSGSTAWNNGVRSRLYLTTAPQYEGEDPDLDARVLSTKKSNYSRSGDTINLRWRNGAFVREYDAYDSVEGIERRSVEKAFLEALQAALDAGMEPSHAVQARGNYAPKLLAKRPEVKGYKQRDLIRAMDNLVGRGEIVLAWNEESNSRRKKILVPSNHPLAKGKMEGGLFADSDTLQTLSDTYEHPP